MSNFKVYTAFNKSLDQTAPSAWKCPKTQLWGPLTNWKFERSLIQGPTYTLAPSPINIQNRSKHYAWIYHGMHWTLCYRSKLSIALKSKDLATHGFPKKIPDAPTKTRWSWAQFQKGQPTPRKTTYAPQIYSLWQALDWGQLSKILASMKMGGA